MAIGYACINLTLQEKGIFTTKGMTRKTWLERGLPYASQLSLRNAIGLMHLLDWNIEHGIGVFRMTSDLFPWHSEYRLEHLPDYPLIRATLEECGKKPIRITTHPGPYNKLAGEGQTLQNTIQELENHSEVFDLMGLQPSHWNKINIHVGGVYGDKTAALARFAATYQSLSENLRKRLTVENDDKGGLYSVRDLLPLSEQVGIPIVFDYFHHSLHPDNLTEEEAFLAAYNTWDVKPVFHFSSSRRDFEDPAARREAHSDWLHQDIHTYGKDVDIMLETKMKELALQRSYPA
ncbi:MAG: UV DNA damage repair endonuclease UvsE [Sphingobacteriales bacterium]|nr:MAG: UV DNA damage repair endonuclease UvsE [Sphingobacteriales bacterium]